MVPTVLRIVLPSVTMVEMIGAVVMATPVAVAVTVPLTLVMRVVSVTVATPPFAEEVASEMAEEITLERADPEALAPEPEPWLAQKLSPNAMAVAASAGLQTALEQSRTPYRKS